MFVLRRSVVLGDLSDSVLDGRALGRFGAARRRAEAQLERLRAPLRHGLRLTLLGAHANSGRATTTVLLGSVLAAVRGEPVLAVDGAPTVGALAEFLTGNWWSSTSVGLREVARLPDGAPYRAIRARTAPLPSGLRVLARGGLAASSPAHPQEYARMLALTDPYYSFVLTDWSPARLDESAEPVLKLTDRLVLCCATHGSSLDAAARTLETLREGGHRPLADGAVVAAVDVQGAGAGRGLTDDAAGRLGVAAHRLVRVPFDPATHQAAAWNLNRLRPATTRAYVDLAAAVLDAGAE